MNAVEIDSVTKTFGSTVAVSDLSLVVPGGCVYGFIGPNGSGKTTTLRMIMRIFHPDRGRIAVLGEDATSGGAASDRIGYLPEERGLYRKMTVSDILRFYARMKGHRATPSEIDGWLERLGLPGVQRKRVDALSKGMAQKVQFLSAILHKPKLLILDEPFSGLDPANMELLKDAILEQRRNGATVIFSTHDMDVAEKMCDFIFMIFKARKVLDGTLNAIQDQYGEDTVRVRMEGNGVVFGELPGVEHVSDFGGYQELRMGRGADPQSILRRLSEKGRVRLFEIARPSLRDIFIRIVGQDAAEAMRSGATAAPTAQGGVGHG